jgi:micrococcal nuclease
MRKQLLKNKSYLPSLGVMLVLVIIFFTINQPNKIAVDLVQCVDGDTVWLLVDQEVEKIRFLSIDAPEINNNDPMGLIVGEYACDRMSSADSLKIELDKKAHRDNYDRLLVWMWVDDQLLQLELVSKGYAKVAYLYDDYKYNQKLLDAEKNAKASELGIWASND